MSNPEIAEWVEALGTCRSERISVIEDLLKHARMDSMSQEDLLICHSTLEVLRALPDDGRKAIPKKRLITRDGDDNEEDVTHDDTARKVL